MEQMLQRVTVAGIIAVVASCNNMTKRGGSPCACMLESSTYSMRALKSQYPYKGNLRQQCTNSLFLLKVLA